MHHERHHSMQPMIAYVKGCKILSQSKPANYHYQTAYGRCFQSLLNYMSLNLTWLEALSCIWSAWDTLEQAERDFLWEYKYQGHKLFKKYSFINHVELFRSTIQVYQCIIVFLSDKFRFDYQEGLLRCTNDKSPGGFSAFICFNHEAIKRQELPKRF